MIRITDELCTSVISDKHHFKVLLRKQLQGIFTFFPSSFCFTKKYFLNYLIVNQLNTTNMIEVSEEVWEIYQDIEGNWRWAEILATGAIEGMSESGFISRDDCIADAMKFGYWDELHAQ